MRETELNLALAAKPETQRSFSILAVIPAYNEATRIADTVTSLKTANPSLKIVVIDDGSSDGTLEIVRDLSIEVLSLPRNRGKGAALNAALAHYAADIWLFLDADLGNTAPEGLRLLEPILEGKADVVVGDLPPAAKKGGFGLVKTLARWGIKKCAGIDVAEPLSGQRALRNEVIEEVKRFENGYGIEVGMTIDAVKAGFRFREIPVDMSHAETGRDVAGFLHRGRQFYDVMRVIMKRIL